MRCNGKLVKKGEAVYSNYKQKYVIIPKGKWKKETTQNSNEDQKMEEEKTKEESNEQQQQESDKREESNDQQQQEDHTENKDEDENIA